MRRNEHLAGDLTAAILLVEGNGLFVRGELKDRISRRVQDPCSSALVLLTELCNDLRAAANDVANDLPAGPTLELSDDVRRKTLRVRRKGPGKVYAGNLPVTRGAVLSSRCRFHQPPCPGGILGGCEPLQRADIAEAGGLKRGKIESIDGARDVPEGVAAHVAIVGGVRSAADPDAVENDDRGPAFHVAWR